ncbi:transmembrane protein, putative [Medicago truncatula]|uniref:Transmembrane protein, putative n=1 Tax=Medicago truncatula TaxID=3880 RepID=A0A072U1K4_MEDTR|nr:transmembrane protein, putative [Medicago truncatula]
MGLFSSETPNMIKNSKIIWLYDKYGNCERDVLSTLHFISLFAGLVYHGTPIVLLKLSVLLFAAAALCLACSCSANQIARHACHELKLLLLRLIVPDFFILTTSYAPKHHCKGFLILHIQSLHHKFSTSY